MSFIVQPIAGEGRVQIGAEELLRPLAFGTKWTRIRIGLRFNFNASKSAENCRLAVGVCQGPNGLTSLNTTDWWGLTFGVNGMIDYSFAQGSPNTFSPGNSTINFTHRVGNAQTLDSSSGTGIKISALASFYSVLYLTITKGSPNYSLLCAYQNVINNHDFFQFMTESEDENHSVLGTQGFNTFGPFSLAASGSELMDLISVSWNHSVPTLEITDLLVKRLL